MHTLDLLTDADLATLASALRSGRLHAPFTTVSIQRHCAAIHANAIAIGLQQLHDDGMQPHHLALLPEMITVTRARAPRQTEIVDLVWTGPEALGVTNRDTGVVVRDLFGSAETEVMVVGFAVYQGRSVFKRLSDRMKERSDLRVRFFLDVQRQPSDTSLDCEVLHRFAHRFRVNEWPGDRVPELYYDPRSLDLDGIKRSSLHAKCIVVDRSVAFVTSANFTEAAQMRNIEVGALIRSRPFAEQLANHFDALTCTDLLKSIELV